MWKLVGRQNGTVPKMWVWIVETKARRNRQAHENRRHPNTHLAYNQRRFVLASIDKTPRSIRAIDPIQYRWIFSLFIYLFRPLKSISHIWLFCGLLFLFSGYKIIELYNPSIPFFHSYLEDILAMPIFLKTSQLILQCSFHNYRNFTLNQFDIVLLTGAVSIYFEAYLPSIDVRFTQDLLDVFAYTIRAGIFFKWMNKPFPITQFQK